MRTTVSSRHSDVTGSNPIPHTPRHFVRVSSEFRRDHALRAAAIAYNLVRDLSAMIDAEMAALFYQDRTTFNRQRNGKVPSTKSKTRQQILRLGENGGNPWPLVADDMAAAVQCTIARQSTATLRATLPQIYRLEEQANGCFNLLQHDRLTNRTVCEKEERDAQLRQISFTLISVAIQDELSVRPEED